MSEINGFKIDQYNIYKLDEGKKYQTCPLCSALRKKKTEKCFTAYWDNGIGKCSHCGELVQLHTYLKKETITSFKVPEWHNNTELSEKVVKWFEGRKISQFILRLMKIGEGKKSMPDKEGWKEKNTVQFPYFRNLEPINIKYRSGDKAFILFAGAEKIPYNLDNVIGNEVIYWVEGEMDVLAVMECGIHNVTSPPNGFTKQGNVNLDFLNNDIEIFLKAEKLILAFDNDIPGQNGKREFIRRFGAHKCYTVDLKDCKDSNDYLIKYGKEALKLALETHIEIPLENVSSYNDNKEKVRNFFLHGMPKGLVTGKFNDLDKNFSVNLSHIVVVTGKPSSGKSDVVDQMVIGYALKYGYKTAYASPENKPNELHHQKILRKLNGYAPREQADFNKSFEACEDFAQNHFYMIDLEGGYDLERILQKAEELVFRKGIRILVIDPFNKTKYKGKVESITGNRVNDYTNAYLSILNDFGVKMDVLIFIVAHPVKMQKLENGKRAIPDFYDVKAGGEMYDMCHHGLVIDRDYENELTLIRTLKVKFLHLGENNKDSWYKYNINSGRFNDIEGTPNDLNGIKILWDNKNWVTEKEQIQEDKIDYNPDYHIEPNLNWGEDEEAPF